MRCRMRNLGWIFGLVASGPLSAQSSSDRPVIPEVRTVASAQLGRTLSLSTDASGYDRDFSFSASGQGEVANAGTTVVQPSIRVSVTVHCRWELINKP